MQARDWLGLGILAMGDFDRMLIRGCLRSLQFAIRPTIRNHHVLTRDGVIKQLADVVGPAHKVDLKNYDLLVVVEIYRVSGCPSSPFVFSNSRACFSMRVMR